MKKDFLTIRDMTSAELAKTLALAADMKKRPKKYAASLKGKGLAMIFEKPSLRTRVTFDVGIHQLGGFSVPLMPSEISLGKRESVHDVALNLERMVHGIMIRTFGHDIVVEMARVANVPVINALTDFSHPCQALADFLTLKEAKGKLKGLKLTYVGDGNNVAHSLMFAGARLGVHVTLACPDGYHPNAAALADAQKDARATGARIEVVRDPMEGVAGADAVYTDVWASMGQEAEAEERKKIFKPYQVNAALMSRAKKGAIFLHCLPAHRGDEVTDEVIDGRASWVFPQAENRLHVQKAVMLQLMK